MKQAEFEQLTFSLMKTLRRVTDQSSLLRQACQVFSADMALLLREEAGRQEEVSYEIMETHPPVSRVVLSDSVPEMRKWYAASAQSHDTFPGYAWESPDETLQLGKDGFGDALVAFSGRQRHETLSREEKSAGVTSNSRPARQLRHELILLRRKKGDSLFCSYHCWAVAQMLRQFEFYQQLYSTQLQLAKEETRTQQYAGFAIDQVIPWECWEELKKRMADAQVNVAGSNFAIWTSYRVRLESTNLSSATQEFEQITGQYPLTDVAGDVFEHIKLAANQLASSQNSPEDLLCSKLLVQIAQSLLPNGNVYHRGSMDIEELGIPKFVLLIWKVLDEVSTTKEREPFRERQARQLISIYLERAWWYLREMVNAKSLVKNIGPHDTASTGKRSKSGAVLNQIAESAKDLLNLTSALAVLELSKPLFEERDQDGFRDLSRENLRFYFATLLAGSSPKIHRFFLGKEEDDDVQSAPPRQKRAFIASLCRLMLSIVRIVQKRHRLFTEPRVVSPHEELDALLHLIDRYVHVELEVPEILNVRDHLSRQITSEVGHYLGLGRYRDHLLHVIDVFSIGHLLLTTELQWIGENEVRLVEHFTGLVRQGDSPSTKVPECEWMMRNWAVASLLHDIGYQFIKGERLVEDSWARNQYFRLEGEPGRPWLDLQSKGSSAPAPGTEVKQDISESFKAFVNQPLKPQGCDECFPPNLKEFNDHGILSALRVSQVLINASLRRRPSSEDDEAPLLARFEQAIHAIAHHNLFDRRVSLETHPLSCLLRICDELQEADRYRVNIEKVLKDLYLDLQHLGPGQYPGNSMLASFATNIVYKPHNSWEGLPIRLRASLPEQEPHFQFLLRYRDPAEADFDATMTLLSKAYNFQHLDLSVAQKVQKDLRFSLELRFPSPEEYGDDTEYDILRLFAEEEFRSLPPFHCCSSIANAEDGVIRLRPQTDGPLQFMDRYAILLGRSVSSENRHRWLPCNPKEFFKEFQAFKQKFLRKMN